MLTAKVQRMTRKARRGGVLDAIPEGATVKPGAAVIDGAQYAELADGRIARVPIPAPWVIRDGQLVAGPFAVRDGKVVA